MTSQNGHDRQRPAPARPTSKRRLAADTGDGLHDLHEAHDDARRLEVPHGAPASPGGATRPVTPCAFTHGTPVGRSVLTTGSPQAMASTCTSPNASVRS